MITRFQDCIVPNLMYPVTHKLLSFRFSLIVVSNRRLGSYQTKGAWSNDFNHSIYHYLC